jgi:osmotically-inducible protein OsmY
MTPVCIFSLFQQFPIYLLIIECFINIILSILINTFQAFPLELLGSYNFLKDRAMDDITIKKSITEQLAWDNRLQGAEINVEYQKGIVRLTGTVPNYFAKNAAETDALQINGVLAVKNELKVKDSDLKLPSDDEVRERVKDVIYWNNNIDYSKVDVLVQNHVVTLLGSVNAIWKVSLAEDLAYSVKGVARAINKLSVVPGQNYKDELIARDIMDALERNSLINEKKIVVQVNNGLVTLEGKVDTWHESKVAYDAALHTKGVKNIQNNLIVSAAYSQ